MKKKDINPVSKEETLFLRSLVWPLLVWYDRSRRDLPWRRTKDPYRIWVSEIMLQQTRVEAVRSYYERFIRELPDVSSLARCPEDRLLKLWEGLGYYSRVRNMQKAARVIEEEYGGEVPRDAASLLALPGIGAYTAGSIASIAFEISMPAVDGNVLRIISRLYAYRENILLEETKERTRLLIASVMEDFSGIAGDLEQKGLSGAEVQRLLRPSQLNQALMELGALVCVPSGSPECGGCPWSGKCRSCQGNLTGEIPLRLSKTRKRRETKTILILEENGHYAIRKRPAAGLLAGLYEFPSIEGSLSAREAVSEAERLGLSVDGEPRRLPPAKHVFSHVIWDMEGYYLTVLRKPAGPAGDPLRKLLANQPESGIIFADLHQIRTRYALPGAFSSFLKVLESGTASE